MKQNEFNHYFKLVVSNWQVMTLTDRRLHYNDLMESHYKDGNITQKQRNNWGHPSFLTSHKNKIDCSAY